jgi:sugar/nucleoside kinase (ribokinase family)
MSATQVAVIGNVNLDIICSTVDDVPRHNSIRFDRATVAPGGNASNVAIGLAALGVPTALVAHAGDDLSGDMLIHTWRQAGIDTRFVLCEPQSDTGVAISLVDSDNKPRFLHAPASNHLLTPQTIPIDEIIESGVRFLHTSGYFVMPGLLDPGFPGILSQAQSAGIYTTLDVVESPDMDDPSPLWTCLPHLDIFTCNDQEAARLTGHQEPQQAALDLLARGTKNVIVKLGKDGVLLVDRSGHTVIPTTTTEVVDTTGAGDAFIAGLLAALQRTSYLPKACKAGNRAGSLITTEFGAATYWLNQIVQFE